MCDEDILDRIASSPDRDDLTTGLMLVNIKNDIIPVISTRIHPKVLNMRHPVQCDNVTGTL